MSKNTLHFARTYLYRIRVLSQRDKERLDTSREYLFFRSSFDLINCTSSTPRGSRVAPFRSLPNYFALQPSDIVRTMVGRITTIVLAGILHLRIYRIADRVYLRSCFLSVARFTRNERTRTRIRFFSTYSKTVLFSWEKN